MSEIVNLEDWRPGVPDDDDPLAGTEKLRLKLTWPEVLQAAQAGSMYNMHCLFNKLARKETEAEGKFWESYINGMLGEVTLAKHKGLYWSPTVGKRGERDVGGYQVKTNSSRRLKHLMIQGKNNPGVYVGVLNYCPVMYITGWIAWPHPRKDEWWRESFPGSRNRAYFVPREVLGDMAELPPPDHHPKLWLPPPGVRK